MESLFQIFSLWEVNPNNMILFGTANKWGEGGKKTPNSAKYVSYKKKC